MRSSNLLIIYLTEMHLRYGQDRSFTTISVNNIYESGNPFKAIKNNSPLISQLHFALNPLKKILRGI